MAVTQADIDALNRAIADGVRQVTINGQTTTYNTTDSLIRARNDLQAQLNLETAAAPDSTVKMRPKQTYLQYGGRGYHE